MVEHYELIETIGRAAIAHDTAIDLKNADAQHFKKTIRRLDRLEKLRGDRSPTSSGMIVSESIYAAVCGMCGM